MTMLEKFLFSSDVAMPLAFAVFCLSGGILLFLTLGRKWYRNRLISHRFFPELTDRNVEKRGQTVKKTRAFISSDKSNPNMKSHAFKSEYAFAPYAVGTGCLGMLWLLIDVPFDVMISLFFVWAFLGAGIGGARYRQLRRIRQFTNLLPEAIDFLIRGARVGRSIQENIRVIGQEMPPPIGPVFHEIGQKLRIGLDLETSFAATSEHFKIKEFHFLATTLVLQNTAGGDYAAVLEKLSRVLRDRQAQALKVDALTSEARLSAKIVSAMTLGIVGILSLTNESQFIFLVHDPAGRDILLYCGISTGIGFLFLFQLLKAVR